MPTNSSSDRYDGRTYMKSYNARPEVLERHRVTRRWVSPHARATAAAYRARPDVKLRVRCARYGITPDVFEEYLDAQEGACGYCGHELPKDISRIAIDHDHATGAIRGLTHILCNANIAHAEAHFLGYMGASGVLA